MKRHFSRRSKRFSLSHSFIRINLIGRERKKGDGSMNELVDYPFHPQERLNKQTTIIIPKKKNQSAIGSYPIIWNEKVVSTTHMVLKLSHSPSIDTLVSL